jgi:hypothetical protein
MNILKQIVMMFLDPNMHEEYLRGWKHEIAGIKQDFECGAVEYHRGRGDAYAALECLGAEVE